MGHPANHRTDARCGTQPRRSASQRAGTSGRKEGESPPPKETGDPVVISAALGPMGGRFSPSRDCTPGEERDTGSMEVDTPSPSLPQRRLRSRRRIIGEDSPEVIPGGSMEASQKDGECSTVLSRAEGPPEGPQENGVRPIVLSEAEQPPEWPQEGPTMWSDGERRRGGDEPPQEEHLITLG